jgi:hypothetical protein
MMLASSSRQKETTNSEIRLWNTQTGELLSTYDIESTSAKVEQFISQEMLLAVNSRPDSCGRGGGSSQVLLFNTDDLLSPAREPRIFRLKGSMVTKIALSADKRIIAEVSSEICMHPGEITVWDVSTGAELWHRFYRDENPQVSTEGPYVTNIALNPQGTLIAVDATQGPLSLWEIATGQLRRTFAGQTAKATSLTFDPNGRIIVSGNENGDIQVWEISSGNLLYTLAGHTAEVTHLIFGDDENTLISSSQDGTVRLWHINPAQATPKAPPSTQESLSTLAPTALFHPIYLDVPQANAVLELAEIPQGNVMLDNVPFYFSDKIFKSQASTPPYDTYPTSIKLVETVPQAYKVHLLLNTGNGFSEFKHKTVGQVLAYCDETPMAISHLRLGIEIREWHTGDNVISKANYVHTVWYAPIIGSPGQEGYIDKLTICLPTACQTGALTAIEIVDTSTDTVDSLNPAINLAGVTIEYRQ